MDDIDLLLYVAETEGRRITTSEAAGTLKVSQQSISRRLRIMREEGLLRLDSGTEGTTATLTGKAKALLNGYGRRIEAMMTGKDSLSGTVLSGSGEGRFYTEIKQYKSQFRDKLNIETYPGTLNLRVNPAEKESFLAMKNEIHIDGFKTKERTYGPLQGFLTRIADIQCAIIQPERTHHREDVVEVISSSNLRKEMKIADDDKVVLR
jgi:riboflavin kinase, archaea type